MDPISDKVKKWIEAGKDPRSAYWQAGLESIMDVFEPFIEPGKLSPIQPLEENDIELLQRALEVTDLSPNLLAAFLPPAVANKITPPESAAELQRIDPNLPSYKIIVVRPGEERRIICAELSTHAIKPGIDIFQAGTLLGTYEYGNQQECMESLNKVLRTHIWEKRDQWGAVDYKRYTVNWFERVMDVNKGTVVVDQDFSILHTPTLIKSNRIDAAFLLIYETFRKRADHPDESFEKRFATIRAIPDAHERETQFNELAQKIILQLLSVMKDCELIDFESFTNKENKQFNQEFDRTARKMVKRLTSP